MEREKHNAFYYSKAFDWKTSFTDTGAGIQRQEIEIARSDHLWSPDWKFYRVPVVVCLMTSNESDELIDLHVELLLMLSEIDICYLDCNTCSTSPIPSALCGRAPPVKKKRKSIEVYFQDGSKLKQNYF